jgi:hypothetical protein
MESHCRWKKSAFTVVSEVPYRSAKAFYVGRKVVTGLNMLAPDVRRNDGQHHRMHIVIDPSDLALVDFIVERRPERSVVT